MTTKTIERFEIVAGGRQQISMPKGAEVLVGPTVLAHGAISVHAVVDNQAPRVRRTFWVARTGEPVADDAAAFLGTVNLYGGTQVMHVFDCGEA